MLQVMKDFWKWLWDPTGTVWWGLKQLRAQYDAEQLAKQHKRRFCKLPDDHPMWRIT